MFKNINNKKRYLIFLSILFPLVFYIIPAVIFKDPDFITFIIPFPFDIFLWLVMWVPFVFFGWIGAVLGMIFYLSFLGYLFGIITFYLFKYIKKFL